MKEGKEEITWWEPGKGRSAKITSLVHIALFIAPWKQNYFFITKCQHRQCQTSIFPWLPSPFINMWRCKPKWLAHHPKLAPPPPPYLHLTVPLIHNKFNFLARHLSDRTEQLRLQSQNVTPPHIFLCLAKHYKTSKLMFHHHNRHGVFPVSNKVGSIQTP